MKFISLLFIIFLSFEAFSAMSLPYLEGTVHNFDEKNVTLIVDGKKINVPREAFSADQKIMGGNKVVAQFDPKVLKDQLKGQLKKKKKADL